MISRHKTDFWIKNKSVDVSVKEISGPVDIHWHEFYELELILDGAGTYNIDGTDYKIEKGSLFFMSPSSFHHINFTENTRLINFMFTLEVCDFDFLCDMFDHSPHISLKIEETDISFIYTLAENMLTAGHGKYVSLLLNCILGKVQGIHTENIEPIKDSQMQYAMLYIQNHFRENLSLNEVASIANYTPNYFSNKFKEYTGTTFKKYIQDLQFSLAVNMLKKTNFSVTRICYHCGFRDFSNFMVVFKKRYGISPGKFRKQ